jgi:Tfp pilus assembly PilM family ATPase
VRLVVVSKRLQANRAVCIERLEIVPLDAGVVIGSDFVNRPAIAEALREAFSRLPARGSLRTLRCAMALPSSATLTAQVPLKKLTRVSPFVATGARDPRGLLEPAVLAEAERMAGIERGALSVDWSIDARDKGASIVSIAATARQHVEARVETAAAAGIVLSAIDGEPVAALRALRYSASREIDHEERYLACWVESAGLHAWLVSEDEVENELRYPSPEYSSVADALLELAGGGRIDWIYMGGDIDLLERAGASTSMIATLFGCPVMPFECAPFCNSAQKSDDSLRYSPLFAVAMGLALREVMP